MKLVIPCALFALLCSCVGTQPVASEFDKITDDFLYGTLALAPAAATQSGYHRHNGTILDEALDDYSSVGIAHQRAFFTGIQTRLAALDASKLDKEQQADVRIMRDAVTGQLYEFNTIQAYRHNPTVYVELAGNALYVPYVLNYAAKDLRFSHIIRRMEKLPALMEQARANLIDAPEVWNRVAREENEGNVDLIDKTLRAECPESLKISYNSAAVGAIAALKSFSEYLEKDLSKRTSDWRLGKEKYAHKFDYVLQTGKTPEQLLAEAEADVKATHAEMQKLVAPKTIRQALDEIAQKHSTQESYMDDAKKTLAEATAFVKEKGIVTLPPRSNLEVIPTPEFMRGIYSVAGFNAAPALQPELGAFYWVTPLSGPKDRVESKLREYNNYGMRHITVHEAMPGHYVQLEYANDVQPKSRRLLRNIFGNGPYIEGWAFYTQQVMMEEGYLSNDPAFRLTFYKQLLRVLANTILDIRLQTMGMTEQAALDLMMNDAFQEKAEAVGKLQRAQLSSAQLPMYYSGWKGWTQVREHVKQAAGASYSLKAFHERALKESAVPLPTLDQLMQ